MSKTSHQASALWNGQEAHLWVVNTENLPVTNDNALLLTLSQSEQGRYHSLQMPSVKREYLITRALIRRALSYYVDVAPSEWEFVTNQYGRPRLAHQFDELQLNFNLSHSHGAVACLIARKHQVGVDIEPQSRKADFSDFSDNVLTSYEQAVLNNGNVGPISFLHYWTLKEAYSKALGLGLSLPFTDIICVFYDEISRGFLKAKGFTELPKEKWQLIQAPILNHHLFAIAIGKTTPQDIVLRMMHIDSELVFAHPKPYLELPSIEIPHLFIKTEPKNHELQK